MLQVAEEILRQKLPIKVSGRKGADFSSVCRHAVCPQAMTWLGAPATSRAFVIAPLAR